MSQITGCSAAFLIDKLLHPRWPAHAPLLAVPACHHERAPPLLPLQHPHRHHPGHPGGLLKPAGHLPLLHGHAGWVGEWRGVVSADTVIRFVCFFGPRVVACSLSPTPHPGAWGPGLVGCPNVCYLMPTSPLSFVSTQKTDAHTCRRRVERARGGRRTARLHPCGGYGQGGLGWLGFGTTSCLVLAAPVARQLKLYGDTLLTHGRVGSHLSSHFCSRTRNTQVHAVYESVIDWTEFSVRVAESQLDKVGGAWVGFWIR